MTGTAVADGLDPEEIDVPREFIAPEQFEGVARIFAAFPTVETILRLRLAATITVTPDEVEMIRSLVMGWLFNINGARLGENPELFEETRMLLNRWAPVQAALNRGTIPAKRFVVEHLWDARDYYATRGKKADTERLAMLDSLLDRLEAAGARYSHGDGSPLGARQREVLGLLAEGKVCKQIASELGLSSSTVRTHLHQVYLRLGVVDRAQAVLIATERGWL